MPYSEPTSPVASPTTERPLVSSPKARPKLPHRRRHSSSQAPTPSTPMMGLPRRASQSTQSSQSAQSTPLSHAGPSRRGTLNNSPKHAPGTAAANAIESMRGLESLPRRTSPGRQGILGLDFSRETASPESTSGPTTPPPRSDTSSLLQRQRANSSPSDSGARSPPRYSPRPPRPTDLVRKKSGEIVKPSLKQRSMSTPDLGRGGNEATRSGKSKSSHNLRERTKSVRFDDLELESVVLFLRGQKPAAVSKSVDGQAAHRETDDDHDTDLSDLVHFRTRRGQGRRSPEESSEIQIDQCSSIPRVRLDFGPGTQGLLKNENVVLERVEMSGHAPLSLRGSVLVRNVTFEKWVALRFTLDEWQTVSEVLAQHASHIPAGTTGDEGWDRFSFTIKLEDYRRKLEARSLLLCVRYSVHGHEWWDSNGGENYRITFKTQTIRWPRSTSLFSNNLSSMDTKISAPRSTRPAAEDKARHWMFPRTAPAPPPRPDSPALSPPPRAAFKPPSTPDIHSHLRLKKYCAPSPPLSPPKTLQPAAGLKPIILPLAPERAQARPRVTSPMKLVHGHPANDYSPLELPAAYDEEAVHTDSAESEEGEATPVATRARSPESRTRQPPELAEVFASSPVSMTSNASTDDELPTPIQRNTTVGDLRSLTSATSSSDESNSGHPLASVNPDVGLMTPPSSNLSSPPTPSSALPPASPTTSMSTSESSPLNTQSSSTPDEAGDALTSPVSGRVLNAASYQEFLDKFCFFKSPPAIAKTLDESYFSMPVATYASRSYFSYDATTPPGARTPSSIESTFNLVRETTPTPTNGSGQSAAGSTPRASPTRSPAITPGVSPVGTLWGNEPRSATA